MPTYLIYTIVLLLGTLETYLSTNWMLYAVDGRPILSSFTGFLCMLLNLTIIAWAIKGDDTIMMIVVYCISCAIGNYISVKLTKRTLCIKK